MIGLIKSVLKKKENQRTVSFRSFGERATGEGNLFPLTYENCDCRGGVLRGGIGLKKYLDANGKEVRVSLENPTAAYNVFFVRLNKDGALVDTPALYLVGLDEHLYLKNETSSTGLQRIGLGKFVEHCALKNENRAIYQLFFGEKGAYATLDGSEFSVIGSDAYVGAGICGKRYLLLLENGEVYYTPPFTPYGGEQADPDGAGTVCLPAGYGPAVGMKVYEGQAYIFLEKGIFKLAVSASAKENTLQEIPYTGGKICPRAQAVTGEGILFLASDGAYYLRNGSVEKICEHLPIGPCNPNKKCRIAYCDDVVMFFYYRTTVGGDEVKRVAIYADGKDGYFVGVDGIFGGNAYTYIDGTVYQYTKDEAGITRSKAPFFTSKQMDFGTEKKKRLKELSLKGKGSVTVGVKCGDAERKYDLTFTDGVAKTRLLDTGKAFSFTFYPSAGSVIESMDVRYVAEG